MKDESSSERNALRRVTPTLIVLLLLLLHVVLVASNIVTTSATNDETLHVVAGHTYLSLNDFRLNPEHPPLVKELAALPLRFLDLRPSDLREVERTETDHAAIGRTLTALQDRWARSLRDPVSQWMFAHELLYGVIDDVYRRTGALSTYDLPTTESYWRGDFVNDAGEILVAARIPMLAFSLTLALLVFFWARELRGTAGGVVVLALFALEPNFIAHAALVTTDVAVCTGIFGACYFVWRSFQRLSFLNVAGAALFASVAATSKFSAATLFAVLPLFVLYRTFSRREWPSEIRLFRSLETIGMRAAASAAILATIVATSWVAIWAVYGFRFTAVPDRAGAAQAEARAIADDDRERSRLLGNRESGSLPLDRAVREGAVRRSLAAEYPDGVPPAVLERRLMSVRLGAIDRLVTWTARHRLLPEGYVYGFATMRSGAKRSAFLRGRYGYGFGSYFVWTTVLKTPLVTLLAIAVSILLLRRHRWKGSLAVIITMVALYFAVAGAGRINIGHRHILPVIPFLLLLCSVLGAEWQGLPRARRRTTAAIFMLLVFCAPIAVLAPPWRPQLVIGQHLSYFNELSGGPLNGHEQLIDSNFDWGQDLPRLAQWLASRNVKEPVNLCYFGTADPRFHGIRFVNVFLGYAYAREVPLANVKRPALVAVSGTNLRGVYYTEEGRAPWREFLRDAELVGRAGYSIFIYRLH